MTSIGSPLASTAFASAPRPTSEATSSARSLTTARYRSSNNGCAVACAALLAIIQKAHSANTCIAPDHLLRTMAHSKQSEKIGRGPVRDGLDRDVAQTGDF